MADDAVTTLRQSAEEGARRAGKLLAERFTGERTVEFKSEIDLVTDADRAAEAVLVEWLQQRHPTHTVLAEESGLTRGQGSSYRWVVDPLDGTTNYAHRVPHFCVSVAVEGPEGLLAGAVYDPLRDELYSAARGQGATLNGGRLQVTSCTRIERALLATGFPYNVHTEPEAPLGLFNHFIRRAQGIRRMGSAALDLAYVAAGRYDTYLEFELKPWDVAAGALLVMEAGGYVAHMDGTPFKLGRADVLSCGPQLKDVMLAECRHFLGKLSWKPPA